VRIQELNSPVEDGGTPPDEPVADSTNQLESPLTRYPSSVVERTGARMKRYDYEQHKQMGIMAVFSRIIKDNKKLLPVFLIILAACLGGGKPLHPILGYAAKLLTLFTQPLSTPVKPCLWPAPSRSSRNATLPR
jgi:hypothetical protein